MTPSPITPSQGAVERIVRDEHAVLIATLARVLGDLTSAQDAVQDALVRALETWPRDGVPDNPRAWLITVAKRAALDRLRREAKRSTREAEAMDALAADAGGLPPDPVLHDDLLRLIFTCCHPALARETQVALSLRTLCGLSTAEIARALFVPEPTMAKRLTRAKQKIAQAGIPYRVPPADELPDRLAGVLATVYLVFNEGYAAGDEHTLVRTTLMDEALRLGRLVHGLMPDEASVTGLLALMLLHDSRSAARVDSRGWAVPLDEQDRSLWDLASIGEGVELTGEALRRCGDSPDPYVVQAAIAVCHAIAQPPDGTQWDAVISWYDVLLAVAPGPAARLGRASAIAERDGPAAGLAEVEAIDRMAASPWWHAARAELLRREDRTADAALALDRAVELGLGRPYADRLRHLISQAPRS